MRIISGSARGRRLAEFPGGAIRPTSDRVREALFSMLASRLGSLDGLKVLDLFAGTGALGIEALSRGADQACLVDGDRRSCQLIQRNLEQCNLASRAKVLTLTLPDGLASLGGAGAFDLILLDPPYQKGLAEATLQKLAALPLLSERGYICVETDRREPPTDAYGGLILESSKRYGRTSIHLFTRNQDENR